jgi:hypothetical protein
MASQQVEHQIVWFLLFHPFPPDQQSNPRSCRLLNPDDMPVLIEDGEGTRHAYE